MRFVWFWTFWHWSRESFRDGSLLRGPLHGIGSHWDEWFRHEVSNEDSQSIHTIGQNEFSQQEFIDWLFRHWAKEIEWPGNRFIPRYILTQLAQFPPFDQWAAFKKFRSAYGAPGVSAIILSENSQGEPTDVRPVEAILLPREGDARAIEAEGFNASDADLQIPRSAAFHILSGKGLVALLTAWLVCGHRPYPRWVKILLSTNWITIFALQGYLLFGREPEEHLFAICAVLTSLWILALAVATITATLVAVGAWGQGRNLQRELERSQVRLKMNDGLTLQGGSAGLVFCLNTLLALFRAHPKIVLRSQIWESVHHGLRIAASSGKWAVTGVVTASGSVKPVQIKAKLRACIRQSTTSHILVPRQSDAKIDRVEHVNAVESALASGQHTSQGPAMLGFAAEERTLQIHHCSHIAHALMILGNLRSRWQCAVNLFALLVSLVTIAALPDLRGILLPPNPPAAVTPSSPSPYYLWVSLDTSQPRYFQVELESRFWANRRMPVLWEPGTPASVRAEVRLTRLSRPTSANVEDGVVWIERRRRFLYREFSPGERVGRYSFSYLAHIGRE